MRTSPSAPVETRDQLLDVAEHSFSEKGFSATTTRHLAAEAGCNVALISYYFGGKDGLYQEVLVRYFRTMREKVLETRKAAERRGGELSVEWPEFSDLDRARFCAAVYALVSSIFAHSRMHKVLFREMMNGGRNAIAALKKTEHGVKDLFEELLGEMQAKGKLRRDLPFGMLMLTTLGPAVYACLSAPIQRAVYEQPVNDNAQARRLAVYLTQTLFDGWA